ncbi:MAG: N-acetylmuramoyl-L-alanine amidase [Firmicutes bacterium]|nr:N-acetylmuramoyl-L-alanine amidase [Bacillota bacterium]
MLTVVIDPGHGGHDPGAVNGSRFEKDDALRLGLRVRQYLLLRPDVRVVMTRSTDVFVPLAERSRIANNANANAFISLHRNSFTSPQAAGNETFIRPNPPAIAVRYANEVLSRVNAVATQGNRGVKTASFSVLVNTHIPASQLLELGFISNAQDNLLFDTHFDGYARAIAEGILATFNMVLPSTPIPPPVGPPFPPPVVPPIQPPNPPPINPPSPPTTVIPQPIGPTLPSRNTVMFIQQTLNSRYNAGLAVDGVFGPLSRSAMVKALQIELNRMGANPQLVVDGVFGPRTRAAVMLLRQGDRGFLVWILQAMLVVNGFPLNPNAPSGNFGIDGIFGPNTDRVLREFQRAARISADGIAGPITFTELFRT